MFLQQLLVDCSQAEEQRQNPKHRLRDRALSRNGFSCNPYVCSATRTSVDINDIGGAVRRQAEKLDSKPKRFRRSVRLKASHYVSIRASAWEDELGGGRVAFKKRVKRTGKPIPGFHDLEDEEEEEDDFDSLNSTKGTSTTSAAHPLLRILSVDALRNSIAKFFPVKKEEQTKNKSTRKKKPKPKVIRYECNYRAELARTHEKVSLMLKADDSDFGNGKMTLGRKKISSSFVLERPALLRVTESFGERSGLKWLKGLRFLTSVDADIGYNFKRTSLQGNISVAGGDKRNFSSSWNFDHEGMNGTSTFITPILDGHKFSPRFVHELTSKLCQVMRLEWDGFTIEHDMGCLRSPTPRTALRLHHKKNNVSSTGEISYSSEDSSTLISFGRYLEYSWLNDNLNLSVGSSLSNKDSMVESKLGIRTPWISLKLKGRASGEFTTHLGSYVKNDRWIIDGTFSIAEREGHVRIGFFF